jgi:hypothetical protein
MMELYNEVPVYVGLLHISTFINLYLLPTQCVYGLGIFLRMNGNYFPVQHPASDLIVESHCVYCEVRTEFFNTIYYNYGLQRVKILFIIVRTGFKLNS